MIRPSARFIPVLVVLSGLVWPVHAQDHVTVEDYEPRTTLVVPAHEVTSAKYPFVDVHSHWFAAATMRPGQIDSLVADMDGMNMAVMVNLSGWSDDRLAQGVDNMEGRHPSRFVTFANIDFEGFGTPGWTERTVAQLREDVEVHGARGLKIYKSLGMRVEDPEGNRVPVDHPAIDPVWALAGELGIPVLIHSADPANFWQPKDRFNEKWLELKLRPERWHPPGEGPTFEEIIAEQHRVFGRHPGTVFINAHLGWMGHDLGSLGALLDRYPNVYSEVGAVLYELGRQPVTARQFLTDYKDRILFGKDAYNVEEYHTYFRTFETSDEYFDYYRKYHAQWKLYGLDLPDDVLKHIYYKNALRIIPGLDPSLFPAD
jgi:predicted TIM-barrel fold metal-dependent hydrolase